MKFFVLLLLIGAVTADMHSTEWDEHHENYEGSADLSCPEGQIYKECGTACPNVCGHEPAMICMTVCVEGCQCPDHLWMDHDGTCVEKENCSHDIEIHDVTEDEADHDSTTNATADHQYVAHDLSCQQYEGFDDECHRMQAWTCHYAEWRLNFYTVWLNIIADHMAQYGVSVVDSVTCPTTEVNCASDNMKVCTECSVLQDCHICYCSDHKYENIHELRNVWMADYNEWYRLIHQWQQEASNVQQQHQNVTSSNPDGCY